MIRMLLKLGQSRIIWYLFASFMTVILCSFHLIWFVKYVFFAKIMFVKTSTIIVKYESWVIKSKPTLLNPFEWNIINYNTRWAFSFTLYWFIFEISRFLCKMHKFQNLWHHHRHCSIMEVTLLLISFEPLALSKWN